MIAQFRFETIPEAIFKLQIKMLHWNVIKIYGLTVIDHIKL